MSRSKRTTKAAASSTRSDWPPADVVAGLWNRGITLRALSRAHGFQPGTLSDALRQNWPKAEAIIAAAIGLLPETNLAVKIFASPRAGAAKGGSAMIVSVVKIAAVLGVTTRRVNQLAAAAGLPQRKMPGRGGANGYDESIVPLVTPAQRANVAPLFSGAAPTPLPDEVVPAAPIDTAQNLEVRALWAAFENAPDNKKREATKQAEVARAVADRAEATNWTEAYRHVAGERNIPIPTVRRWSENCRAFDRADYPAALLPRNHGAPRDPDYDERIWAWFYADYGRQEEPAAMASYRRVAGIAEVEKLSMPHLVTLMRRWKKQPHAVRTLLRKGPRAAAASYPHQTRSVAHLRAMQACNADGHIFDVFVRFPDGEVGRPILAAIQDLYSRMIVAWRLGEDRVRGSRPDDLLRRDRKVRRIRQGLSRQRPRLDDQGADRRDGSSVQIRRRNALEDFKGVLTFLDIHPIAVKPFHGQSKPIERSFGDICTEKIARHPLCAGAYTGNSPGNKPENYGSKAIPLAEFQALVDQQIALHNRQPNRRTEICRGVLSFEQAFMESWKQSAPRMLAPSQKFLFLLKTEPVTVRKPVGEIELFGNRFTSAAVAELAGQKVVARFDPQHIQKGIRVYRLDGAFVGEAECIEPVGYDDLDAARDQIAPCARTLRRLAITPRRGTHHRRRAPPFERRAADNRRRGRSPSPHHPGRAARRARAPKARLKASRGSASRRRRNRAKQPAPPERRLLTKCKRRPK